MNSLNNAKNPEKLNEQSSVRESLKSFKIVVFDIGNTNVTIGVPNKAKEGWRTWRLASDANKTSDQLGMELLTLTKNTGFDKSNIDGVVISSVVSDIGTNIEKAVKRYYKLNPVVVSSDLDLGIDIKYDNPKLLGADRICGAVGAYHLYGGPLIVVDLGTATTIDAVDKKGNYLGGVIMTGLKSMNEGLMLKAPKLPRINVERPEKVIGTNTIDGIRSGFYGYVDMIDGMVDRIKKEMNIRKAKVIGTGGLIGYIAEDSRRISEVNDDLILEGCRIIYGRNKR